MLKRACRTELWPRRLYVCMNKERGHTYEVKEGQEKGIRISGIYMQLRMRSTYKEGEKNASQNNHMRKTYWAIQSDKEEDEGIRRAGELW